ncbi:hypothetical protein [Gemmata sp.]|uniref:hypothetical protein n=1 Tax=Gemmata sp. TaxID=1914242 RepID=UPI003F711CD0
MNVTLAIQTITPLENGQGVNLAVATATPDDYKALSDHTGRAVQALYDRLRAVRDRAGSGELAGAVAAARGRVEANDRLIAEVRAAAGDLACKLSDSVKDTSTWDRWERLKAEEEACVQRLRRIQERTPGLAADLATAERAAEAETRAAVAAELLKAEGEANRELTAAEKAVADGASATAVRFLAAHAVARVASRADATAAVVLREIGIGTAAPPPAPPAAPNRTGPTTSFHGSKGTERLAPGDTVANGAVVPAAVVPDAFAKPGQLRAVRAFTLQGSTTGPVSFKAGAILDGWPGAQPLIDAGVLAPVAAG